MIEFTVKLFIIVFKVPEKLYGMSFFMYKGKVQSLY